MTMPHPSPVSDRFELPSALVDSLHTQLIEALEFHRSRLSEDPADEDHPLAPFGPGAAAAVLRTDAFPHTADLMVNSSYDPGTGEVHAFEEQVGSHGGLGGGQGQAFLLYPKELAVPPGPLVGAEAVHRLLPDWLAQDTGEAESGAVSAPRPPAPSVPPASGH